MIQFCTNSSLSCWLTYRQDVDLGVNGSSSVPLATFGSSAGLGLSHCKMSNSRRNVFWQLLAPRSHPSKFSQFVITGSRFAVIDKGITFPAGGEEVTNWSQRRDDCTSPIQQSQWAERILLIRLNWFFFLFLFQFLVCEDWKTPICLSEYVFISLCRWQHDLLWMWIL